MLANGAVDDAVHEKGAVKCDYSYQRSRLFCLLQINLHGLSRVVPGVSSIPAQYGPTASRLENCASVRGTPADFICIALQAFI